MVNKFMNQVVRKLFMTLFKFDLKKGAFYNPVLDEDVYNLKEDWTYKVMRMFSQEKAEQHLAKKYVQLINEETLRKAIDTLLK